MPIGQMTIFYCGKVNVYDDVPADKVLRLLLPYLEVIVPHLSLDLMSVDTGYYVGTITNCCISQVRALMHIAASPLQVPDEQLVDGSVGLQPLPCIPKTVSSSHQDSAVLILPTLPAGMDAFVLGLSVNSLIHFHKASFIFCVVTCLYGVCMFMWKVIFNTCVREPEEC